MFRGCTASGADGAHGAQPRHSQVAQRRLTTNLRQPPLASTGTPTGKRPTRQTAPYRTAHDVWRPSVSLSAPCGRRHCIAMIDMIDGGAVGFPPAAISETPQKLTTVGYAPRGNPHTLVSCWPEQQQQQQRLIKSGLSSLLSWRCSYREAEWDLPKQETRIDDAGEGHASYCIPLA
ncbi:hypothetical protein PCL_01241 [Purpureocillium lilacinum]|uniref:Uncharacterized protein n=1 Tax=Purpureocillium lilacinum TaxID=33203 RepID=A0A2U3E2Z2_PURLI|nr:hypothetical protein PCL_01241 [Purpureocillium lilacinum]